jgi:hypothetical protein
MMSMLAVIVVVVVDLDLVVITMLTVLLRDFDTPGTGPKPYSSRMVSNGGAERLRSGEGDIKVEVEEEVGESMLLL